jgi:hypothetical protein
MYDAASVPMLVSLVTPPAAQVMSTFGGSLPLLTTYNTA